MSEKKSIKIQLDEKFQNVKQWCGDHKEYIFTLGPVLITGSIELIKIVSRRGNIKEEKRLKDNYIYDRPEGHYYELRRKLKSSEWIQIDERKANGEKLGNILRDMRVLK